MRNPTNNSLKDVCFNTNFSKYHNHSNLLLPFKTINYKKNDYYEKMIIKHLDQQRNIAKEKEFMDKIYAWFIGNGYFW